MPTAIGRAVGFVCGLFLVIVGFALLSPDAGLPQGGSTTALVSVLIALGIGVIAASLLPNSIVLDGEKLKPLGINLNASGGAAFFIVTLIFLFYTLDRPQPGGTTGAEAVGTVAAEEPIALQTDEPSPAATLPATAVPPAAAQVAGPTPDQISDQQQAPAEPPGAGGTSVAATAPYVPPHLVRAATYCNICCPMGPAACPQSGWGQAPSFDQAAEIAQYYCVAAGGVPESCAANVTRF